MRRRALALAAALLAAAVAVSTVDGKRAHHVAAAGGPCRLDDGRAAAPIWGACVR